jgi:hypothetical protein
VTVAGTAVDDLRPHLAMHGGMETLGLLLLVCANASRGLKRLDDSRAWAGEAAKLADRTDKTDTMGLFFGPTNVNIWRIGIEVDGGDPARAAPQHLHSSPLARETSRALLERSRRQAAGTQLNGLCERMQVG